MDRFNFAQWASLLLATLLSTAFITNDVLAFDLKADEIRGKSSKTPVTVLQNRAFLKTYRPEAGLILGTVIDEAYLDTAIVGARAGMFINEWLGFEAQMLQSTVSDSTDRKALNKIRYEVDSDENTANAVPGEVEEKTFVTVDPEVNAIHSVTDLNAIAAPFYGKLNFINKFIIYTDIYATAGMSVIETDQGNKNAFSFGFGERFYVGKSWSFRVDFRDRMFTENRAGIERNKNSMTVDLGASYFFK